MTIARAELILVPALAVDRRGVRLGRGAGYYDRTLLAADPAARLVVVVRDEEVVERLPEEAHDVLSGALAVYEQKGNVIAADRVRATLAQSAPV